MRLNNSVVLKALFGQLIILPLLWSSSAQQPRALTNWTVDPLASAADGDAIFASTQLPVGRARMTLMCVRHDKDNNVKVPSTLELQLDLESTKFDIDVQTRSSQYEDHDFCPMPSPTPYNPYNVIPVPCNYRTETRYTTERTIHVRERTGRNQTQPLEIDAPDARVTNLEFYRDIDFLSSESIMYGFSAGGDEHIIQFSTHTPAIKSFVDRCSSPSEEQSRLIKEIADRKAAAEAAEAARQEQARIDREQAAAKARIAQQQAAEQERIAKEQAAEQARIDLEQAPEKARIAAIQAAEKAQQDSVLAARSLEAITRYLQLGSIPGMCVRTYGPQAVVDLDVTHDTVAYFSPPSSHVNQKYNSQTKLAAGTKIETRGPLDKQFDADASNQKYISIEPFNQPGGQLYIAANKIKFCSAKRTFGR